MPILSKDRRIIWSRRIKGFWEDYSHNKIGILGLIMLSAYIVVAIISPYLVLYDPVLDKELAENYSMPEWVSYIVPAYRNLPRTLLATYDLAMEENPQNNMVTLQAYEDYFKISYGGNQTITQNFTLTQFEWPYNPISNFILIFGSTTQIYNVTVNVTRLPPPRAPITQVLSSLKVHGGIYLVTPEGTEYLIYNKTRANELAYLEINPRTQIPGTINGTASYTYNFSRPYVYTPSSKLVTDLLYVPNTGLAQAFVNTMFNTTGTYRLKLSLTFQPDGTLPGNRTCDILFLKELTAGDLFGITLKGQVWGVLGTDNFGRDVFSQLVLGVRISLFIGLVAAVLSTSIGVGVGVMAGYLGGAIDEFSMRVVDVLMCIPVLPLLLVLITMFGASFWYLILIVALFFWLGLSRIIRSQVLSIREMPFIECAVASGAPRSYIMLKHIVPNIIPVALTDFVLTVPGAIVLEAALSFIGFGDPNTPTWGKMLADAQTWGAFQNLSWWVFMPPGLGIIFLCLTFVFIGHALDEVVNPRLRKRR